MLSEYFSQLLFSGMDKRREKTRKLTITITVTSPVFVLDYFKIPSYLIPTCCTFDDKD